MIDEGKILNISYNMEKFSQYGPVFSDFVNKFYNFKFSYNIIVSYLESVVNVLDKANAKFPESFSVYKNIKQIKPIADTVNFINILERNIKNISEYYVKTVKKGFIPEQNPELMIDINSEDRFGFPHGWTDYVNRSSKSRKLGLKVNPDSPAINWNLLFSKLLNFSTKELQEINDDIFLEYYEISENIPRNKRSKVKKQLSMNENICKNIFSMTPRSVMSDLQILEYFFVNNSCENCLTYHIDRFYNIALINSEIENTPTAEKIRMNTYNATIKQSEIPKKTDAIKDIQMFLKTLKAKDYDNVSRYQIFFDFDVALDIFSKNDGDIYPLPKTFQKQPHMMFMSLFLIKEIHKRDNMIFRAIREKFNSK